MQFLTLKRFKKLEFNIPNLHKFPTLSQTTEIDGDELLYQIRHNNNLILEIGVSHYQHDSWMHYYTQRYATIPLIELGILNPNVNPLHTYDGLMIIDSIYHFCNPLKKTYSQLNDKQKQSWRNKFRIRWSKYASKISGYTLKLFNEYFDDLLERNSFEIPDLDWDNCTPEELFNWEKKVKSYIDEDLRTYSIREYTCADHAKKCFSPSPHLQDIRIGLPDDKWIMIRTSNKDYTLTKFNLTRIPTFSDRYIDLSKHIYFERKVWNKSDVELVTCQHCGTETFKGHIIDDLGCLHCLDKYGKIHNYSTRVPNILTFKAKKVLPKQEPIFLGIELEYESDKQELDAKIAGKLLDNHAILKSDGSVRHGFEIVTCPATLDIHLEEFKQFFSGKSKYTKLYGASNTGMHVHISRKALSRLGVGKMIAFLNNPRNKSFLEKIGGRELNNYCRQDNRTFTYEIYNGNSGARYNILNVNNEATVEIRMFSTPETYEDFASKVEFAECLSKYCSPANSNKPLNEFINFDNFKVFAMNYKRNYPHFTTVIKGL